MYASEERTQDGTEIHFHAVNNEPPVVNGSYINYAPKKTFSSPYISGTYGDPVILVTCGSIEMILDFSM
ncbi:MAG: hypothetical protein HN368_24515 [Spirochaetales bacterium]|jgi:hypothetical protein|nr:hypothetical protein [Spirochaetales bacterium]